MVKIFCGLSFFLLIILAIGFTYFLSIASCVISFWAERLFLKPMTSHHQIKPSPQARVLSFYGGFFWNSKNSPF